jgi:acyl-CoA synthetase (NDP forming)
MEKAKQHFLDIFFNPNNIAVVGATKNPQKMNFHLVRNLVNLKFPGRIYPVNPNADEILGLKAYPSLESIEDDVDLVVTAVPAVATMGVIEDCVRKAVKGVVIVSGGFSEIGWEGRGVQDEMHRLLRERGIRAVGPNSLSPINTSNNLAIGFGPIERLKRGGVSFIFQSGLYNPRLDWIFSEFNLGISKLADLGNKMDINEVDTLEYLAEDPDTKVIAMHLESVAGDGKRLMQLIEDTTREKPVVVIKSGRTPAGAEAASSHTGAMMGASDAVFDVMLRQSGAIRAQGLEEFFDFAKAFDFFPPLRGNRIAVAALSGGEGVIATDWCCREGLSIAKMSPETVDKLQAVSPPWGIPSNPFDLGVSMQFHPMDEVLKVFFESMADDPNVDCIALQLEMIGTLLLAGIDEFPSLLSILREKGKPFTIWMVGRNPQERELVEKLESNHIPVYTSSERAAKAFSALYRYNIMQRGASKSKGKQMR